MTNNKIVEMHYEKATSDRRQNDDDSHRTSAQYRSFRVLLEGH